MRRGTLVAGVSFIVLMAACSNGPGEGVTEMVSTTPPPNLTPAEGESDTRPQPSTTTAGPPARGGLVGLELIATGFDSPTFATEAPGQPGRLYIVEQAGRIRVLEGSDLLEKPFLDISSRVSSTGNEQGLLSAVFHPDHESNGLLYVNYTDQNGDTRVVEFRVSPAGDPVKSRELLYVRQPYVNHNGGQLAFGPDGLLYVGMGDGGASGDPENRAQDLSSRFGKLLRLDVSRPGAKWETFGYGLRNPWRFSFDGVTGDLWIGDVGQGDVEEIDFVAAADLGKLQNFGWDVYEGSDVYEDKELTPDGTLVEPLTEYTHKLGCSVTGGYVYRGEALRSEAWGRYFYGDYCSGRIWSVALWEGELSRRGHGFRVEGLTSFAEDLDGELYALARDGSVFKLVAG